MFLVAPASVEAKGTTIGDYHFKYHFKYEGIVRNLLCIHRYEAAWNDSGSPYWGGMQMDLSFQKTYGPRALKRYGTADHWPVWQQLRSAVKAVLKRGYGPWPNTRKPCGV